MLLLRTKLYFNLTISILGNGKQVLGQTVKTLVQMSPYDISLGYVLVGKIKTISRDINASFY